MAVFLNFLVDQATSLWKECTLPLKNCGAVLRWDSILFFSGSRMLLTFLLYEMIVQCE